MSRPVIGRPLPRFEDLRLVRGAGHYTDDFSYPDEAFVAFVRSPHSHARIRAIDTSAAARCSRVIAVLTGADYAADGHKPIAHGAQPTDAIDPRQPAFRYPGDVRPFEVAQPVFATDTVRFVGETVAMVVAESAAVARDAADLVEVEYAVLPAVADIVEALASGAAPVWDEVRTNVALDGEHGDAEVTEQALAAADVVVQHQFRNQRIVNAQLEPRSAIGLYDPVAESYTMVAGSQGVSRQHLTLAACLGVPKDNVRVVCPDVGGGFGPRSYLQPEQVAVVWAAQRLGRPVRWTSTRSEAFVSDQQGRDSLATLRLGLQRDGRIVGLAADCVYNVGAHTAGGYVPIANFSRILCSVYDVPAAYVRMRGVLTHTPFTGPFRGAGRPEAMFMLERLLDLAASRLGLDRVELRRRNLITHEQLPYTTPLGLIYDSGAFRANMERALELADWAGFPERRAQALERGVYAGIGVANYVEAPVGAPYERIYASVRPDGTVEVVSGTQSTGQGHETTFAQVVADQLELSPSAVRLLTGDTSVVTSGGGTHSDRSMRWAGTLLVQACAEVLARSRSLAASTLEVAESDLAYSAGAWSVAGTDRSVSLFALGPVAAEATFAGRIPAHPTGCAVCEVEVDASTGSLRIVRYTAVDDAGQPINPLILEGQVAGGIAQGVGQALLEHMAYEGGTAQPVTASFLDYALPRASLLPALTMELTEDPTSGNPLRVKGGGEAGITPALAAVANAVADALSPFGVADVEMPLTPSRVWGSLSSGEPRAAGG